MKNNHKHIPAIVQTLVEYIIETKAPIGYNLDTLPRNESLVELGILDSFGVIELVEFLEETWNISIDDADITKERMGSIYKMAELVADKSTPKALG